MRTKAKPYHRLEAICAIEVYADSSADLSGNDGPTSRAQRSTPLGNLF
jgi:hypothetical protein